MADLGNKKVRKSNFSPEEVEALVNTVSKHYNILYGEFAKRAVNKHARHRVWLDVTKHVNRVSVERRTLQEVKNKWKKCQHLYRDPDKLEFPDDFVVPNVWEPLTAIKDSMPLEQRLTKTPSGDQEPVLQSQPLSPTKLKVTRQAAKPPHPSPKAPTPEPPNEEVCLRWNSHHSNMQSTFPNLLLREQYVDATLVAEGQTLKCHRLILSSCSPYFEEVLSGISPFQHPVLFMKDIPFWILKSLCDFMYAGEVHIYQNKLEELLVVAETLKIKGLAGKTEGASDETKPSEPVKEEKKDEKEAKDRKKQPQPTQQTDSTAPKPNSKTLRSSSHTLKKGVEKVHKEIVKGDDILDPLDLLEPVYEELTKESKPPTIPAKFRESKSISIKKGLPKKIKKRKLSEEREESPPPLFLSRKGTRSRPNVKIPKYYHTHYERVAKNLEFPESTIVREPHTDQADPLMEVEEIKAEPLDFQDDVIEIEDNVVSFSDQEMPSLHEEEIIGNYDSPIVNINDDSADDGKEEDQTGFKKISLLPQPIIMDVHSVSEKSLNTLKIVDVAEIKGPMETLERKSEDPLATEMAIVDVESSKEAEDPLNLITEPTENNVGDIAITNVESIADVEMRDTEGKDDDNHKLKFHIAEVVSEHEEAPKGDGDAGFHIEKVVSEHVEASEGAAGLILDIANVVTENEETKVGDAVPERSLRIDEAESKQKGIIEGDGGAEFSFVVEKVVDGKERDDNEENTTLGFHIAKVASEQFAMNEALHEEDKTDNGKDVISEDCSSELGFQITNVISGHFVELEDSPHNSELETIVNDSEESHGKKDSVRQTSDGLTANTNNIGEETECIADSLEELLEK